MVDARGSTNLGEGWLRGCEQVARYQSAEGVNRTLLLTDGLANQGMTDGEQPMADQIADPLRDHRALLLSPSCPGSHRHGLPVDLQDPASHL